MTETRLGDADEMFRRFFDRWYSDSARKLKGVAATRPDMTLVPGYLGQVITDICPLTEKGASDVLHQIKTMRDAAMGDWPRYLPLKPPIELQWVDAFDRHYDLDRVTEVAARSDPSDFSNDYCVLVCEFGAVLGAAMIQALPRLAWLPSWPYWESAIFDSRTGNVTPVFHWAIKKFSTYGIDDGFAAKLQVCVQILKDDRSPAT